MPSFSLPWVIGPIPILATVWAAYISGASVAKKGGASGEAFVAALLLPSGLIAIACQLFLSDRNFFILLISSQIVASGCFLLIIVVSKSPTVGATKAKHVEGTPNLFKIFCISSVSYILFNMFLWIFPGSNRCSIAKCFAFEWALGRIDHVFSRLYLETAFGAFLLAGIISLLYHFFLRIRRDRFSN